MGLPVDHEHLNIVMPCCAVQDGIVAHLCHLLLSEPGPLPQQASILDLLTLLTTADNSTACMDLHDESAVPRLVIMLAQPSGGLSATQDEEARGYVNSVPDGEAAPVPTEPETKVQEATGALLVAACTRNPQCLEHVCFSLPLTLPPQQHACSVLQHLL